MVLFHTMCMISMNYKLHYKLTWLKLSQCCTLVAQSHSNAVSPPVPLVPAWITAHTALGFHKHIAGGARGAVDLLLTFDVHITITVQVLHRLSALADDALMQ